MKPNGRAAGASCLCVHYDAPLRSRRIAENPWCPVHGRGGEWVFLVPLGGLAKLLARDGAREVLIA